MMHSFKKKRQWIGRGLVFVFLIGIVSSGLILTSPTPVFAVDPAGVTQVVAGAAQGACPTTGAQPAVCPAKGVSETTKSLWDKIITPSLKMVAVKSLIDFISFASNRIAYEAAVYVANGGPGEGSMFYNKSASDGWKSFGKDIGGQAFADLSDITKNSFGLDLCVPPDPMIRLNLQLSIKQNYTVQTPRCDFDSVTTKWGQVVSDASALLTNDKDARDKFLFNKLSEGLKPGSNQLGASIGFLQLTNETAQREAQTKLAEQIGSISIGGFTNVKDLVTGQTKTPAAIVSKQFDDQLKKAKGDENQIKPGDVLANPDVWYGLLNMSVSTFTNTLTSQLFNRVYKGLFSPKPDAADPFNTELAGGSGSGADANKADLGGIFTATPVANPQYDLLGEFSQCPPDGTGNRSLNSCVIDASVVAVISRGGSSAALTVQEAIDQKVLNGDWPLISSKNASANQDRLCYTYGFCYGNLVKLRKARIISIGWELAADKNSLSNPTSLKDVVAGFNDVTSPWYHLIDPNWVLKAPESQCRAAVNGEIRVSAQAAGRQNVCADSPTCIGEDNSGKCTQGFGYCVEEKNIWRVKGDECPAQYATCLTLKNTTTGKANALLLNTVDDANCTKQNAGCAWNKTLKTPDAKGVYQWYTGAAAYNVDTTSGVFRYAGSTAPSYSYEDRLFVTHNAKKCDQAQAGCTELNVKDSKLALNLVQNGSFEKDEDKNNVPDGWSSSPAQSAGLDAGGGAVDGSTTLKFNPASAMVEQIVSVVPGNFYTLSVYVLSQQGASQSFGITAKPLKKDGSDTNLTGLSIGDTCVLNGTNQLFVKTTSIKPADGWTRFACTFSLPKDATQMSVQLSDTTGAGVLSHLRFDGVQLESGEIASSFGDGYNIASPTKAYLKLAPSYLGCKGLTSDPKECDAYAQVCSAQDVGCNLYTPNENGPAVPAIASALDACPNVCVGYNSFRQEGTKYEPAKFPVYFIASKAGICTANAVGCDGFTKLGTQGGETQEYFTNLRACLTPDMTTDKTTQTNPTSATYFTWEGSDKSGFQLRTWQLLQSNTGAGAFVYTSTPSAFLATPSSGPAHTTETNPNLAPCTKVKVTANDAAACDDSSSAHMTVVAADASCDEHTDIFANPDCREFFDSTGLVHYRKYSETVSVDAACTSYRKNTSTQTDCTASGGFWTEQGFCRYFGLQKESKTCSAAENGCRAYAGGAGRNSTTILNDTFESGSASNWIPGGNTYPDLSISNESVSTSGHSVHLTIGANGSSARMSTVAESLSNNAIFNVQNPSTCTSNGGTLSTDGKNCLFKAGNDLLCQIGNGESKCGALVHQLQKGKTYTLTFWAKGSGTLQAQFSDGGSAASNFNESPISLANTWNVFSLGPIDTNAIANFNSSWVLRFNVLKEGGSDVRDLFIDNIQLVQTEEKITRIKDSWVTPAICDQSPDGAISPQYYLGCKGYTDRKGVDGSYYQFSHVCSEKAIGCSAYYNTYNSNSASAQVTNARCVNLGVAGVPANTPAGTLPNGKPAVANVACTVSGTTYCTISAGQNYCVFSTKQIFTDPLPNDAGTHFAVVYGPEAVVTPQDQTVYLVDNGNAQCSVDFKGCREVGAPTYAQDLKTVTKFDSKFVMDTPEDYGNILCENQALFCDEFSSTKDGNFYFKDPLSKTCEYKTSVTIAKKTFSGWFRSGTSIPCYSDANGKGTYLVSGDQSQIWKNGDTLYDGWIGTCDSSANRCTELIDSTDTSLENHGKGKSYYVINNDKLSENAVAVTQKCEGRVGQKAGCALFNNTTISQLKYSASASYALSLHADLLLSKPQNSLVDPISCTQNGGVFAITAETAQKIGTPGATSVDLCQRRCEYTIQSGDVILSPSAHVVTATKTEERSCLLSSDCPSLKTKLGATVSGSCSNVANTSHLQDDSNTVLKVNRDRTCAAWLACDSSRTTWDAGSNKYIQICDSVNLCTQTGSQGDQSQCQAWNTPQRKAVVMTEKLYSARDVSWAGIDYSGYEIPHQLPVERFSQVNLNPKKWCKNNTSVACESTSDCLIAGDECVSADADYRLVFNAGVCDSKASGEGSSCVVGQCSDGSGVCSANGDCKSGTCQKGYCSIKGTELCTTKNTDGNCACAVDADCSTAKSSGGYETNLCNVAQGVCMDKIGSCSSTSECNAMDGVVGHACIPIAQTIPGNCFSNRCLAGIRDIDNDGFAEPVTANESDNAQSCRGYPEFDSPFPQKVVKKWKILPEFDKTKGGVNTLATYLDIPGNADLITSRSTPSEFVPGYDSSTVCSPYMDVTGKTVISDDCVNNCSYTKAVYEKGFAVRYFPADLSKIKPDAQGNAIPQGICTSGVSNGHICHSDADCTVPEVKDATDKVISKEIPGTCQQLTSTNTMYGWKGYCLEKDSSIQLNGSTTAKDQACLTWLPVDQLSGATDLYGKEMTAGYPLKNTYYCAEEQTVYTLGPSASANDDKNEGNGSPLAIACADTTDQCIDNGIWSGGFQPFIDAWNKNKPFDYMYCPKGYFALVAPCGKGQDDKENIHYCSSSKIKDVYYDQYPYVCIPLLAKKPDGTDCKMPQKADGMLDSHAMSKASENGHIAYLMYENFDGTKSFDNLINYYKDCKVSNIGSDVLGKYFDDLNFANATQHSAGNQSYNRLNMQVATGQICGNVVQTSTTNATNYNAAWTDRLWENDKNTFAIAPVDPIFSYVQKTVNTSFGASVYPGSGPIQIAGCNTGGVLSLLPINGVCPQGSTPTVNDSRLFKPLGSDGAVARARLQQIFARSFFLHSWQSGYEDVILSNTNIKPVASNYSDKTALNLSWIWDNAVLASGANGVVPTVPIISSVGNCVGTSCKENRQNQISVNGVDTGDVEGFGNKHVSVTFYVHANPNQMPLRNVVIDWGDDMADVDAGGAAWPINSKNQSGSTAPDNFYKNHRGLSNENPPKELCDDTNFGQSTSACSSNYVLFTHDYVCSSSDTSALLTAGRTCGDKDPKTGSIITSPCVEKDPKGNLTCVFQPRVYAKDNWGWCTGYCDGGPNNSKGCFGPEACKIEQCPGGAMCNGNFNPWTYFDGSIKIKPIQ